MADHPIQGLMSTAMEKIREMVDVNTIIGDPINLEGGTVIIPVSKVSFGFASGGSDIPSKNPKELFGGGSGAGISIQPLAFIIVTGSDVKLLQMTANSNPASGIISMVPDMFDKISGLFNKDGAKKEATQTEGAQI